MGSPPPTRGTLPLSFVIKIPFGITPAYAGNTFYFQERKESIWDHPRLRGEHQKIHCYSFLYQGSPPPTRGTLGEQILIVGNYGITPAYAGNTYSLLCIGKWLWDHPRLRGEHMTGGMGVFSYEDHPRLRGEHFPCPSSLKFHLGSPPPTRGTHEFLY